MGLLEFLHLRPRYRRLPLPAPASGHALTPHDPPPLPQRLHGADLPAVAGHATADFQAPDTADTEAAKARFKDEMKLAKSVYGKQVFIQKIRTEKDGLIGCLVQSRGKRPFGSDDDAVLLVPVTDSGRPAASAAAGMQPPRSAMGVASQIRRRGLPPEQLAMLPTGGPLLPDPRLDPRALSPMQAAEFAAQSGYSPDHDVWVVVFVPAPGAPKLSNMEHALARASSDYRRFDRYDEVVLVPPSGPAMLVR